MRPVRANIVREFENLIKKADSGDQVLIYLAGHGSRQPDDDPDNPEDIELDGMDELFLPADVSPAEKGSIQIRNAITDDELRDWLRKI